MAFAGHRLIIRLHTSLLCHDFLFLRDCQKQTHGSNIKTWDITSNQTPSHCPITRWLHTSRLSRYQFLRDCVKPRQDRQTKIDDQYALIIPSHPRHICFPIVTRWEILSKRIRLKRIRFKRILLLVKFVWKRIRFLRIRKKRIRFQLDNPLRVFISRW